MYKKIDAPIAQYGWPPFVSAQATKSAHTQMGAGSSKPKGTVAAYRAIGCFLSLRFSASS
jgi:hypothetical protein